MAQGKSDPILDALSRVRRGLAAYLSYLTACGMNQAFSEYVLYEPTLRILTAQRFIVRCECECPGIKRTGAGDKKRIDFVATSRSNAIGSFALEMKWSKKRAVDVTRDMKKLNLYRRANPSHAAYICVFGEKGDLEDIRLKPRGLRERGRATYAGLGRTRYGCRTFQVV